MIQYGHRSGENTPIRLLNVCLSPSMYNYWRGGKGRNANPKKKSMVFFCDEAIHVYSQPFFILSLSINTPQKNCSHENNKKKYLIDVLKSFCISHVDAPHLKMIMEQPQSQDVVCVT